MFLRVFCCTRGDLHGTRNQHYPALLTMSIGSRSTLEIDSARACGRTRNPNDALAIKIKWRALRDDFRILIGYEFAYVPRL